MSNRQWRTIIGIAVAVVTYLLTQPVVQGYPWALLVLGIFNVGLAVVNVPDDPQP